MQHQAEVIEGDQIISVTYTIEQKSYSTYYNDKRRKGKGTFAHILYPNKQFKIVEIYNNELPNDVKLLSPSAKLDYNYYKSRKVIPSRGELEAVMLKTQMLDTTDMTLLDAQNKINEIKSLIASDVSNTIEQAKLDQKEDQDKLEKLFYKDLAEYYGLAGHEKENKVLDVVMDILDYDYYDKREILRIYEKVARIFKD